MSAKLLSPARRRQCVDHLQAELGISERRACAVAGQHRSTQRKRPRGRDDEEALTAAIIRLASQYGRYGYRRITALLRTEGWHVNAKRVQRIWRREGLKVPQKQPKRGRLWLNDGSCIRLRPCWPNHVWSYDFVMDRTHDGRKFRMLTVIDEFTRRCMAVVVERRLNSGAQGAQHHGPAGREPPCRRQEGLAAGLAAGRRGQGRTALAQPRPPSGA